MITPTLEELLSRVAEALEADVVPELAPGYARRQLETALRVMRRVAFAYDRMVPYLQADNADIEATLRGLLPAVEALALVGALPAPVPLPERLRSALSVASSAGETANAPAELRARNGEMQQLLADLREALPAAGPEAPFERETILAALRALFRRMLARQSELAPPPPVPTR